MAIRFDGTTERLLRTSNVPDDRAFTMCGWFQRVSHAGAYASIMGLSVSASPATSIEYSWDSGGNLEVNGYGGGGGETNFATNYTNGQWFFGALTGGASVLNAYAGGPNIATLEQIVGTFPQAYTPGALWIGNNGWGEGANFRAAAIKVWNVALTAAELENERRYYAPQRSANLTLWTPLIAHSDVTDWSGKDQRWTTVGTLSTEEGPPIAWTPRLRRYFIVSPGGGPLFTQSLGGIQSSFGGLGKQGNKFLAALQASSGFLTKLTSLVKSGIQPSSGNLAKLVSLSKGATQTSSGSLAKLSSLFLGGIQSSFGLFAKLVSLSRGGTQASSGISAKLVSVFKSGTQISSGILAKFVSLVKQGTQTSFGVVNNLRTILQSLSGTQISSGGLSRFISKGLSGVQNSNGNLLKLVSKSLSAVQSSSGIIRKLIGKSFGGTQTSIGGILNQFISFFFPGRISAIGWIRNTVNGEQMLIRISLSQVGEIRKTLNETGIITSQN